MSDFKELLKQRQDESTHDWAVRLFSSDPTGEIAADKSHVSEHHKPYVCHCKRVIEMCDDASHVNLPSGHSWELVPNPTGSGYLPVLKCGRS